MTKLSFYIVWVFFCLNHLYLYGTLSQNIPTIPFYYYIVYLFPAGSLVIWAFLSFCKNRYLSNRLVVIAFSAFAYILVCILVSTDTAAGYHQATYRNISLMNLSILLNYVILFVTGYFFRDIKAFKSLLICSFIVVGLNLMFNFNVNMQGIDTSKIAKGDIGVYLFLGDSFAVLSLLVLSVLRLEISRVLFTFISSALLFMFHSRTSFYAYCFVMLMYLAISRSRQIYIYTTLVLSSFSIFIYSFGLFDFVSDSRIISSLGAAKDDSLTERKQQFEQGIVALKENLILGDYAGQVRDFADFGAYMHNYLSLWRQFGLIPFLLFSILMCLNLRLIFLYIREALNIRRTHPDVIFFILLSVFNIVEVVSSRSYYYPYVWLTCGMTAKFYLQGARHEDSLYSK